MGRCGLAVLMLFAVHSATAHELPERVVVKLIVQTGPDGLDVMVRAPLEAMRDVDFPLTPEGFLVLGESAAYLEEAAHLWLIDNLRISSATQELNAELADVRAALPGDRAFASPASARAHFSQTPLAPTTRIFWRQAMLDVYLHSGPVDETALKKLSLNTSFRSLGEATRVELILAIPPEKTQEMSFPGDIRNLTLLPSPWLIARDFLHQGFVHVLAGVDHLLFLLCLILPLRRLWPLLKAITAFTLAHSITLIAAAMGWLDTPLWFASAVEALIALSILVLALDNMLRKKVEQRWLPAFGFGLVHGFGFASALSQSLQFAQGQLLVALASFNLGVEAGQLLVLAIALPLWFALLRQVEKQHLAVAVFSALIAHTAWHWMSERLDTLSGYFY